MYWSQNSKFYSKSLDHHFLVNLFNFKLQNRKIAQAQIGSVE